MPGGHSAARHSLGLAEYLLATWPGTVEFRASFRHDGQAGNQHEVSAFVREHHRWCYVDAAG